MSRRVSSREYLRARAEIYEAANGRCENCGMEIFDPTPTNFAHFRGKNISTAEEIKTGMALVCENLHRYEHTRANNLESDNCVMIHLQRMEGRDFWKYIMEKRNGNQG